MFIRGSSFSDRTGLFITGGVFTGADDICLRFGSIREGLLITRVGFESCFDSIAGGEVGLIVFECFDSLLFLTFLPVSTFLDFFSKFTLILIVGTLLVF